MSVICSQFQCRLCQKTDTGHVNVFDASRADGIMVYEVIQELIQIEVNENDGLPSTACRDCCTKLIDFSDFKKMCIRSARELKIKRLTEISQPVGARLKLKRGKVDKGRLAVCTEVSAVGPAVVREGGLSIGSGVIISKVPKAKSRTSGRISPETEGSTTCPVTIKQERESDEEEVITDDFTTVNRGAVPKEEAAVRIPNQTEQVWRVAGADGRVQRPSQTLPVEVFVKVGEDCGLPLKSDGSPVERDPLSMSEEALPCTLITMSDDRVYREERFSESSLVARNPIILQRVLKQEVGEDPLGTSSLSVADTSVQRGRINVLGESSHAEGVPEIAVREIRKESVVVGSRDGLSATLGPRASGNRDTDESGHPFFFKCEECGKMCISRYLLKVHKRVNHSQDPLECKTCGRRFRTKGNLNIHTRTHTGEKPYACKTCDMRFAQKGTLERHFRTHTGERPYPCTMCKKCFATQDALTNHIRTHTGERPYPCDVCGMRYKARNQLLAHMRIHSGEKPFCCVACGKRFGRKDSLNYHLQTHLDSVS